VEVAKRPCRPRKDPEPLRGRSTYAVKVVDEGGNVSLVSPEVSLTAPAGLVNWLTWLLLILIVILLFPLLKRRAAS
jgi:hypothetical protein